MTRDSQSNESAGRLIVFPHAGHFAIAFAEFSKWWQSWVNPGQPPQALSKDVSLPILAQKVNFELLSRGYDKGFDALCRTIVPLPYKNTMQASREFFKRNDSIFDETEALNPASGRMVRAVRLKAFTALKNGATTEQNTDISPASAVGKITPLARRFHLFVELSEETETWPKCDIKAYLHQIIEGALFPDLARDIDLQLPDSPLDRSGIFALTEDPSVSTLNCCLAIIAWGGLHRNHARSFFEHRAFWIEHIDFVRRKPLDRAEIYDLFAKLRREKHLKGVGPAYFTKVIYFLTRGLKHRGFIMDQWTARSANFLAGEDFIDMTAGANGYTVSDQNTGETYERFCSLLEGIADQMNTSAEGVELRLFSQGRGRGRWRNLIKQSTDQPSTRPNRHSRKSAHQ